jgi:class 3 adenylate cyclase/predicted ATPase
MNCPACGAANEPGRKFCGECGTRLAVACPNCGTANGPTARFCGECGTSLGGGAVPTPPAGAAAPAPPTTGSSQPAPVAERRLVTILFVDLVGFTTISEGRDHEEVRELLSRYFEVAREMVDRYGGTIEKFIGDAVMAVWGAPTAHEDDAERAVRAALDLVDGVRGLVPGLESRAGVLTGEAAVTLGAQGQGMVAGDLVNTASRLQSVAPPGVVLVGETTQRATSEAIAYEAAGEHLLKGKAAPVPAWRALRIIAERGGRGRGDRLEAPFVGRDAELRLLKDLFHATTREKKLRLVSITGQGGIGKSRLAWEFLKYVDGVVERVWWHEGRSPSYGTGITFWALGEMVRSRAGLLETDDVPTTRAKVHETVERIVPEGERDRVERALLALLGVGEAPAGGAEELFGAWRIFFERLSTTGIVALLFEDLHWADQGTLDFIDHVLEWSRNVPILIITLARPELLVTRPDWGAGRRNFLSLDLEPLDSATMRELLAGFVPDLPDAAANSIIARADGIPLYAVETIRMLVADGRLRPREDGTFEPAGELGELSVPESLQALIAARLDALEPADRSLVQDAAVLGGSFTLTALAAVSGIDGGELDGRLRKLARSDLVREEVDPRSPERGQFAFVQALIREVAYSTLSMRDRRARHLAAARYFESLDDDELAGARATHYLAAYRATTAGAEADALAAQARVSLRAAAERALRLGAPKPAIAFLEQALEVASDDGDRAEILERATEAANNGGSYEKATELGLRLVALREGLGDRSALARAYDLVGITDWLARRREQAVTYLEARIGQFDDMPDDPAVVRLTGGFASAVTFMGQYERGGAIADRALAAAERLGIADVAIRMLNIKSQAAFFQGRLWEASALAEGARRLADQMNLPEEVLRTNINLTSIYALDDPRATAEAERQIVEVARRLGRRDTEVIMLGNMAEDVRRTGEWDEVIRELETAAAAENDESTDLILRSALSLLKTYRGEVTAEEASALRSRLTALDDRDVASSADDLDGAMALAQGRFAAAATAWLRNAEQSDLNAPYALPKAGYAAILGSDAVTARLTLDRLRALGSRGRAIETDIAVTGAGLAALAGDRAAAIAGFASARSAFHDLGLPWDQALAGFAAGIRLGPEDPEVRRWLEEALATFRALRAQPFMEMTERVLEAAPPVVPGVSSEPAAPAPS